MYPALSSASTSQVSEQGEVVYAFDRDFVGAIRRRSWVQRLRPLWGRVVKGVNYLTRVAFGTALIMSALVVWLGVVALMSSGRDNDRCGGKRPAGCLCLDRRCCCVAVVWFPDRGILSGPTPKLPESCQNDPLTRSLSCVSIPAVPWCLSVVPPPSTGAVVAATTAAPVASCSSTPQTSS